MQEDIEAKKLFVEFFKQTRENKVKKSGNFLFKKEKQGDRRIVTLLGFIKIRYTKKNHINLNGGGVYG